MLVDGAAVAWSLAGLAQLSALPQTVGQLSQSEFDQ